MRFNKPFFTTILFLLTGYVLTAQLTTVSTANGIVGGYTHNDISIFKGIPFAAPPTGALRWKAPQPAADWQGVKQCTAFSASPMQPTPAPFLCWSEEFIAPPAPLSEDCLYLNVWSGAKTASEKRPVFVWIYGGGFNSGSAACAIYDGEEMAKRGIVFVSINYRVGPFGFMAHPELTKEENNASGNYGLLDQVAALQWVKKNIAAFGGNPNQVTLGGQSAGSMSVNALLASPLAKGLFQGAILESGGLLAGLAPASLQSAEKIGLELQKKAGALTISEFRNKSAEEILKASQDLGGMRMGLTLDGYALPVDFMQTFKEGKHNNVPVMMGWVTGDGGLFGKPDITAEKFIQQAKENYGANAADYLKVFPAGSDSEAQASQAKLAILNFASLPAYLMAAYNKKPTFIYEGGYVPTDKPGFPNYGAFHTSEVPFALHTLHLWNRPWKQSDFDVQELMSTYWLQFIKTGNPNGNGLPQWNAYDKAKGTILEINTTATAKPGLYKNEFELLDKLKAGK
ncbi:MAG: carboxylesterase family protein [Ferruginibacter sp.]|uniref:carboxylesterase/lipase family protein n=1 Tax=Ferruginibacter sp. TaxID=1940288 RepID=UPI002657B6DA|nr:carboxylesterase family protein [Ferruginibacter sp.]MDB5278369.1 carboxylesterase family protein [Ferruginibacter sp.]